MMKFHILTLFPEMVQQGLATSILGRAAEKNLISIDAVNIRDYTQDKHGKVDDYTYGGGAGMLMQAQPVYDAYRVVAGDRKVKFFKQFVILKFKGLDNINDIEKYRQKSLYVTRKNAVRLQRDEYFIADLIGLKVQDEDGKELGTVKDVIETGANDVYEVEMADGKSLLLPAIKQCILNVDVENGTMQVHVLEGLLDL